MHGGEEITMTKYIKLYVLPNLDANDCLGAAVDEYLSACPEAEEWQVTAAWEDYERDVIVLTVPETGGVYAIRAPGSAAWGKTPDLARAREMLAQARSACMYATLHWEVESETYMLHIT
jgi:hypothetical protein